MGTAAVRMQETLSKIDSPIINGFKKWQIPLARFALFLVYFWFGLIKLLGVSPASEVIKALFDRTLYFLPFRFFYPLFSLFEVVLGVLFLIKGLERIAIGLLIVHMINAILPLILLPNMTWQGFLVPTLEGQYIIKNILIISAAVVIGARLTPKADANSGKD